jgi:B12-binding domain/radical SAM domain protein
MHRTSGRAALNVVSGALDADPRTRGIEPIFARTRGDAVAAMRAASGPVVVAWSFYSTDFARAADDLAWVRARSGDALHLAGGVHATAEPLATLRAGFDLLAIGEGESTAVAIFTALLDGRDPRGLRGTAHLANDVLITSGLGDRKPLDAFPPFDARRRKFNPIEITRGCVFACSFCQTPFMFKARFRHRSVADVCRHARAMRASGRQRYLRFLTPTALSYGSDDAGVNLAAVEELLGSLRATVGPDAKIYFGTFPCEVRPEHVSERALAILRRFADNDTLVIGGQSGSDRVLDATHRGHSVADTERAVRLARAAGFEPHVDFLFGLPGETAEDQALTVAFAEKLVELGARIHSHGFMPLPGTPLAGAAPTPVDAAGAERLAHLESRGQMYGQWRGQLLDADCLRRARSDLNRGSRQL